MNSITAPSLFLSHGSPMTAFGEDPWCEALRNWSKANSKPEGIIIVSAHFCNEGPSLEVRIPDHHRAYHDFGGFPKELYELDYRPPGSKQLTELTLGALTAGQIQFHVSKDELLDHGIWIPLSMMYPEADIPVVSISLPHPGSPSAALRLGKALASLREEGILLIGSGGAVHNLRELRWHELNAPADPWAQEFQDWVLSALGRKAVSELVAFEDEAPHAERAHPTTEHFYPLFFSLGATLPGDHAKAFYEQIAYGNLSMLSLEFS